jgi:hypothetical protein
VRNDRHSIGRTDITRVIIAFRNYGNARNNIQIILKSKLLFGSPSIFKVQHVPGYKELLNILVKRMM